MSVLRSVEVMVLNVCVEEGSTNELFSSVTVCPLVSSFECLLLLTQKTCIALFLGNAALHYC